MGNYSDIKWENDGEACLLPDYPEICDYYVANGYSDRGIPLNASTAKEICKELDRLSEIGQLSSIPQNESFNLGCGVTVLRDGSIKS